MSATPRPRGAVPALDQVLGGAPVPPYLSVADLSKLVPYAPQTIRNLMSTGVLKLGVHYLKPRGRIMFKWSAVQAWLDGRA